MSVEKQENNLFFYSYIFLLKNMKIVFFTIAHLFHTLTKRQEGNQVFFSGKGQTSSFQATNCIENSASFLIQ